MFKSFVGNYSPPIVRFNSLFAPAFSACVNLFLVFATTMDGKLFVFNRSTPNDLYISRTTSLTSKRFILHIYSTNICTEYFKHAVYSPFLSLQNTVCFIMLTSLIPVLFIFYIQNVLKLKKNSSGAKRFNTIFVSGTTDC